MTQRMKNMPFFCRLEKAKAVPLKIKNGIKKSKKLFKDKLILNAPRITKEGRI
jgi:hypothetical protein